MARLTCALLLVLAATMPAMAQIEPVAPPSSPPPAQVVDRVRAHGVAVGSADRVPDAAESRAIAKIVAGARVIGFGENGHGYREPLQYRNRLIRHLVERHGLTAVALESGFAESRQLYDYVLGGPGEAAALTRTGLTHGFGFIPENVELVEWLRRHNAANPDRRVRLYGIDRSTIQSAPPGAKGYGVILDHLVDYLALTVPGDSATVRAGLAKFSKRFTEVDYPDWTEAERAAAGALLVDAQRLFIAHRRTMIRVTSADRHAWTAREAYDAAQLPEMFAAWVNDPTQIDRLFKLIALRDRAMADHTAWVLAREGPRGKVLLFQTNGHVTADTLVGSVMRLFPVQPKLTGTLLRDRMGDGYRTIATVSSRGRSGGDASLGSVDRAFAAAGRSPVLLDLRDPRLPDWWRQPQSASQGDARVDDLTPARAFDGMLYFERLTRLPPPPGLKP